MVLIISREGDQTTADVISWLLSMRCNYKRVNAEDLQATFKLAITDDKGVFIKIIDSCGEEYTSGDFNSFWYRRGDWNFFMPVLENHVARTREILHAEWQKLLEFVHHSFEQAVSVRIGSINDEKYHNKLVSLVVAKEQGLLVPETYVTTEREDIEKLALNGAYITKAIYNMFNIVKEGYVMNVGTERVKKENIYALGDFFVPTLLQREVPKSYELRIFFINKRFYPMAIFSQLDEMTTLDFRNYNSQTPNRNVPYILPVEIEEKLFSYMARMGLDSGSIDMIVTPANEYVFLEVNPIGQFGWLSRNCNYYLEEVIASYLAGSQYDS